MKTLICAFLLLFTFSAEARAALQFEGFLSGSGSVRFVLSNTESGRRSAWLAIGDTFEGHKVVSFDVRSEVLTLRRESETLRLFLKPATTSQGDPSQPQKGAIVVLLGNDRRLVVTDDPARLESLWAELQRLGALETKPVITLRPAPDAKMPLMNTIMEWVGVNRLKVHIDFRPPEARPSG